jgi:RHS repeat-associated protein
MRKIILTALSLIFVIIANAQNISGPTTVKVGDRVIYTFDNNTLYMSYNWIISHGMTDSTWRISDTYYARVIWNSSGSAYVKFLNGSVGSQVGNLNVTVNAATLPPTPSTTYTFTQKCGSTDVTRTSSPPAGANYDWYWQTSAGGVSTTLGKTATINRTSSATLYLRAKLKYVDVWSTTSQTVPAFTVTAIPPAAPSQGTDYDVISNSPVTLTLSITPVSGVSTYWWYQDNAKISGVTASTYTTTLSASKTFSVSSVQGDCESTTKKNLTVNIYPEPSVASSNGYHLTMGKTTTLSVTNFVYDQCDWYRGTTLVGTGPSILVSEQGDYNVKVKKQNTPVYTLPAPIVITKGLMGQDMNFVVVNTITTPDVALASQVINLSPESNQQVVNYYDDLGRPVQTVATMASPAKKDIVQPVVYDALGREYRKYLPFINGEDGKYKVVTFDASGNYSGAAANTYSNNSAGKIAQDLRPFAEMTFEPSPLSRTIKTFDPGKAWFDANKSSTVRYISNIDGTSIGAEKIVVWKIGTSGLPERDATINSGFYGTGALSITAAKDEHGNEQRVYTDKSGRVILKKAYVQGDMADVNNNGNWTQTYTIYDELGNLRFVLQPELVKSLVQNSSNPTPDQISELAFSYKFDLFNRMIEKKFPGATTVVMIYDNRDRLVLQQDGNQRSGSDGKYYWSFTKYDDLNRPVMTGIKDTVANLTQLQMQAVVNAHYNKAWARYGESYLGNGVASNVHGYSNLSYPIYTDNNSVNLNNYLTITYYDNYDFKSLWPLSYEYVNDGLMHTVNNTTYAQGSPELRVIGQVTGSKVKVLDGALTNGGYWLKSINYYDKKYRVIQVLSDNYRGGIDRVSSLHDFSGKVLKMQTVQKNNLFAWKDLVGVDATRDKLKKTSTSNSWTSAGAASVELLPANAEGRIEFIPTSTTAAYMVGLSATNANVNWTSIYHAIYLKTNGTLEVRENGSATNLLGGTFKYRIGDQFRIERKNGKIQYIQNGKLLLETTALTSALLLDISIYSTGAEIAGFKLSAGAFSEHVVIRTLQYDHAGRLLKVNHKLDQEPEVVLNASEYNEIGQLVTKNLHGVNGIFTQSLDYRFNIRGWIEKINDPDNPVDNDLFNLKLNYQLPTAQGGAAQYNGSISEMIWKSAGGDRQSFGYSYDALNRLTAANYFNLNKSSYDGLYNEKIGDVASTRPGYDLNGNILNLFRNGVKADNSQTPKVDDLRYYYRGNKLAIVNDVITDNSNETGFKELIESTFDQVNVTNDEYQYDANANITKDTNKGLSKIVYNYLNLPQRVERTITDYVTYIYDATGRKLAQQVFGSASKFTDYTGEYVYENNSLQYVLHEEGRISIGTAAKYEYFLKDHLGNVRVTFSGEKTTSSYTTDLEATTNADFRNYNNRSPFNLFDHTDPGTTKTYSQLLNGESNGQVGLAKSFAVNPGDVLDVEVYAKYEAPGSIGNDPSTLVTSLISAFGISSSGSTPLDGQQAMNAFNATYSPGPMIGRVDPYENDLAPRAYLNYILFDENFNLVDFGFDQISSAAKQVGATPVIPHDLLSVHVRVKMKGYLYIYLSNEQQLRTNVYFDDLKILYHTSVNSTDDYYPFGLTFNSFEAQPSKNPFKYNGKEIQDELDLGWLDYGARMYMADLGRWGVIDPMTEKFFVHSPYNYVFNNPTNLVDPDGMDPTAEEAATRAKSMDERNLEWGFSKLTYCDGCSFGEGGSNNQATGKGNANNKGSKGKAEKPFYSFNSRTQARREQMAKDGAAVTTQQDAQPRWPFEDKQAEILFDHWMKGKGETLLLNNQEWGDYMKANKWLKSQLGMHLYTPQGNGLVMGSIHGVLSENGKGGYKTGYDLLNGSNSLVGDFQYWGYAEFTDKTITYYLTLTWNDIIDPNRKYIDDFILEHIYKGLGNPTNYNVHIQWTDVFTIDRDSY